jgi:hypothetical protein
MRISEIVLTESYYGELIVAVQDLLTRAMTKGVKSIPTDKMQSLLAKQGYVTTVDELIQAVDQSGFASSVDKDKIVPKSELPADLNTNPEPTVDVGQLAGNQAMQDVKAGL